EVEEEEAEGKKRKTANEKQNEAKKPKGLADAEKGANKWNATNQRAKWQKFGRWLKNKKRCPAKIIAACKTEETRNSLFNHFVDSDGVFAEVEAKFELSLQEAQRSK
ncbi:unnamed protein product, partial [Durusdinium trenchii]